MASSVHRFNPALGGRGWRVTTLLAVAVLLQVVAGVLFFGTRSSQAWFGSGSCPMPGGFVSGQKCLAVDANGVEVPWKGEIILPAGTNSLSDHAFFTGNKAIAGDYQLQLVEDNGSCCTVYQTVDYTVSATGATTPASFKLNDAVLTEAHTHHAVGTGGLVGYFLYISNPTAIPAGADCQNVVSFLDASGGSLGTGTSGSGEKCNTPTPVPGTGALGGHIIDCTSGVAAMTDITPAGSIAVSGPLSKAGAPNAISYNPVPTGVYTETATAPAGYHFTYNCPNPKGASAAKDNQAVASVTVPLQGLGEGWFYVEQDKGVLAAHVIDCTGGTAAPSDLAGAMVGVTKGALNATYSKAPGQAPQQWSVPADTYTVVASAPAGYKFVECGHPGSTNTANVAVPANGSGGVTFWVAHETGDLAGHIYDCATTATTTEVPGGTLSAAGVTTTAVSNPMAPVTVNSNTAPGYTVTGSAPTGYHFVTCGTTNSPANSAVVPVPANGHGVAVLYVQHDTGDLAGHIYDCATTATKTEVPAGTLSAAGVTTTPVANPMVPTTVNSGTYAVTATAPTGYHLVACGANKTDSNKQSVIVPANGHGVAVFYVRKNPVVTPPGGGGLGAGTPPGGGGLGAGTPPVGGTQGVTTSNNPLAQVFAAVTGVKGAATSQPNTGRADLARNAVIAIVLLLAGAGLIIGARRRARA